MHAYYLQAKCLYGSPVPNFHNVIYMNIQKQGHAPHQLLDKQIQIQAEELDSLMLSQVFEQAKYLINSKSKNSILAGKGQYKKKRLRLILQFVIRKLKSKDEIDVKKYVGLVSLFSFLLTAAQNQQNSLNFPISFYRNLNRYSQSVVKYWQGRKQKQNQGEYKRILSTFLFALTTFCQSSHKFPGLDMRRVFSLGMIKSILELRLCDDERILRHYRILMLYIFEHKQQNLSNSLFLSSLIYHFMFCSSNNNTECALVFLLNKSIKNRRVSLELLDKYDLSCLALKIKTIIFKDGLNPQMCKLAFSLLSKIIELNRLVARGLMGVDHFIILIGKLEFRHQNLRLTPAVFAILDTFSPQALFQVYKYFIKPRPLSMASLELLEFLTQKINSTMLLDMIDTGLIYLLFTQSQKYGETNRVSRHLLMRILDNILHGSRGVNKEISQIIRGLSILRGDQLLMQCGQFSFK